MNNARILITGGSGLIGRRLCARLHALGHHICVLSRNPQKTRQLLGQQIELWQTLDQKTHLNDIDAVINLAGESIAAGRWNPARKHLLCHSRWQLTERLSQLINTSQRPPATFISGSAVGYYGNTGDQQIHEDSPPREAFTHQLCQHWEQLALNASTHSRVCLLRTGIVLSSEGGMLAKLLPLWRAGLGGAISDGRQYLSWIHIDDMVSAIIWLLNQPLNGAFNLTAPHPVSNKDFSRTLADTLHRPALLSIPGWLIRCLLGEASGLLLDSQRILPSRLLSSSFSFRWPHLAAALQHLINNRNHR